MISCACVLPSRLILFDLTFYLVPGPLFLLASVALRYLLSFSHSRHVSMNELSNQFSEIHIHVTLLLRGLQCLLPLNKFRFLSVALKVPRNLIHTHTYPSLTTTSLQQFVTLLTYRSQSDDTIISLQTDSGHTLFYFIVCINFFLSF
jgi:hypothetical protein